MEVDNDCMCTPDVRSTRTNDSGPASYRRQGSVSTQHIGTTSQRWLYVGKHIYSHKTFKKSYCQLPAMSRGNHQNKEPEVDELKLCVNNTWPRAILKLSQSLHFSEIPLTNSKVCTV